MSISTPLIWRLCDLQGAVLNDIQQREGGQVAIARNGRRTAQCAISLEDPLVRQVRSLRTAVKVWMADDPEPIFSGKVTTPQAGSGASTGGAGGGGTAAGMMQINAVDPGYQLERQHTLGFAQQIGVDQSEIMARLAEHVGGNGIGRGNLPASVNRDRTYPDGKQIWEAWGDLSEVIQGPDFQLRPVDRTDGILALLDTFPSGQGIDRRDSVSFEYGFGQMNTSDFSWDQDGEVVNRAIWAGQAVEGGSGGETAPGYVAESLESQALFGGVYDNFTSATDISEVGTLEGHAKEEVAAFAFPADQFSFVPCVEQGGHVTGYIKTPIGWTPSSYEAFGAPPKCGPNADYWIGDVITLLIRVKKPDEDATLDLQLVGQVNDLTLSELDSGAVLLAEPSCSPIVVPTAVTGAPRDISTASS